jgi:O-antigen/teichoic acid export membrane protein
MRIERPRTISLGASTLWFAGPYGLALLGYLAVNALAARLLGTAGFGRFVAIITVTTLLGQVSLLGIHRSGLRAVARLRSGGDEPTAESAELARQLRAVRAVTRLVLPGVGLASALASWFLLPRPGPAGWALPLCVGALVVGAGHQLLWSNYLRGFGDVRVAGLLEGRSGGALVAFCQFMLLCGVLLFASDLGLPGALGAMALGYALPLLAISGLVARRWRGIQVVWRPLADLGAAWSQGARFAVSQAGSYLNANLDLWIAAALLVNAQASLFAAAQRLVLLVVIPLTSLQVVFAPVISRLYAQGEADHLERLLRTAATLVAGLISVFWLGMIAMPELLLGVAFGDAFRPAAAVLVVLSLGMVVQVLTGMCATALSMTHGEGVVAAVHSIGIGMRVCLGVVAALAAGAIGLSVTSAVVTASIFVVLWWQARRRLGLSTQPTLRPELPLLLRTRG